MDDYTPTTEEVRNNMAWGVIVAAHMPKLAGEVDWPAPGVRDIVKAQFDRWLASVQADAWDEGNRARTEYERAIVAAYLDDGAEFIEAPANPHRSEKQ